MDVTAHPSKLTGAIAVPGSKSHTIRAVLIAALADGTSVVEAPLDSRDTRSALDAVRAFGAEVDIADSVWTITGVGGRPGVPGNVVDVGNSGTTLYMIMGTAALTGGWTVLTGDEQIRRRTAQPLIDALSGLGIRAFSTQSNGKAPICIRGPLTGGATTVEGISSQYLSSLLVACPLAAGYTGITVTNLNEQPYVRMTLAWLDEQDIRYEAAPDLSHFTIPGNQRYHAFTRRIPGDFSSAAFPLCAAALAGGTVTVDGIEMTDTQGDKRVVDILRAMGAGIDIAPHAVTVTAAPLHGVTVDMNEIPDALPMLAVTACFARGETILHNVAQARIKETDRIAVMAAELAKLGADVTERPDGLVIRGGGGLTGGHVHGHGDHRVVMALTVAGLAASGPVTVDTAEAADITYPTFWDGMRGLGAKIE